MGELTLVGAVTRDRLSSSSWVPGGAVLYGGVSAESLGCAVRVVTAHAEDFVAPACTAKWSWQHQRCQCTTEFENLELGDLRRQWLWERCGHLSFAEIQNHDWNPAGWVVLAPVFDELELEAALSWVAGLSAGGRCLMPQGWLRTGAVGSRPFEIAPRRRLVELAALAVHLGVTLDCVCLSEAEVQAEPSAFDRLRGVCRCLAVTRGAQGASVYVQDRRLDVGVIDASVCDTTGAGDVFAGALMATLAQNLELEQAVRLASVAAGLSTEQRGPCPLDRERLFALAESVQLTLRAP